MVNRESEKIDLNFLLATYFLIFSHPIYRCISFVFGIANITIPYLLEILYLCAFIFTIKGLLKHKVKTMALLALVLIYAFWVGNYFLSSSEARSYYANGDVRVMLIVTIPVVILATVRVENWEELFSNHYLLCATDLIIVLSFLGKLLEYDTSDYMSYSYDLLPVWCIVFASAFCFAKRWQWPFLVLGIIEGVIYGARGPMLWFLIFVISVWFIRSFQENRKVKYIGYLIASIIILAIFIQYVLPTLVAEYGNTMYFLSKIKNGVIMDDSGRSSIYAKCREILSGMGLNVYGLFYDRTVINNGMYAHNFVYEILISFGWFFGVILLIALITFVVDSFRKQRGINVIFCVYFLCAMFLRYFISGSIFDESIFVVFLGSMYSMKKMRHGSIYEGKKYE